MTAVSFHDHFLLSSQLPIPHSQERRRPEEGCTVMSSSWSPSWRATARAPVGSTQGISKLMAFPSSPIPFATIVNEKTVDPATQGQPHSHRTSPGLHTQCPFLPCLCPGWDRTTQLQRTWCRRVKERLCDTLRSHPGTNIKCSTYFKSVFQDLFLCLGL